MRQTARSSSSWRRRGRLSLVEECQKCYLWPCACGYLRRLRPTGDLAHLREIALTAAALPFPHRSGCPCPSCWSARLRSWDSPVDN
jgi:hypothetical protein